MTRRSSKPTPTTPPKPPPPTGLDAVISHLSDEFLGLVLNTRSAQRMLHDKLLRVSTRTADDAVNLQKYGATHARVDTLFTTYHDDIARLEEVKLKLEIAVANIRAIVPHLFEAGLDRSKVVEFRNDEGKPAFWLAKGHDRDYLLEAMAEIGIKSKPVQE